MFIWPLVWLFHDSCKCSDSQSLEMQQSKYSFYSFKNTDSFRNESHCLYEWVSESFTQTSFTDLIQLN